MKNQQPIPLVTKIIKPVARYFHKCSQETQRNIKLLSSALLFTMLICGGVLAVSICTFWLEENYWLLFFVFPLSLWLYWQLELPIIFSDLKKFQTFIRVWRIFVAIVFSCFNSLLIDSFVFREDITSARKMEIQEKEIALQNEFSDRDIHLTQRKISLLNQIDALNASLMAKRDSLNAEADGRGGTGKPGTKKIWHTKYAMYKSDSVAVADLVVSKRKELNSIDSISNAHKAIRDEYITRLPEQVSNGINKKMELIHKVIFYNGNFTNIFMAILIFIVTTLFELIPIFSKAFYDVSEYFQRANDDRTVIDRTEEIAQTRELQLASDKILYDYRDKEASVVREYHTNKLKNTISYNRDLLEQIENELERLEKSKEELKTKYPEYYDTHITPIMEQAYNNLRDVSTVAISQ